MTPERDVRWRMGLRPLTTTSRPLTGPRGSRSAPPTSGATRRTRLTFRPIPPVGIKVLTRRFVRRSGGHFRGSGAGMGVSAARSILTPDSALLASRRAKLVRECHRSPVGAHLQAALRVRRRSARVDLDRPLPLLPRRERKKAAAVAWAALKTVGIIPSSVLRPLGGNAARVLGRRGASSRTAKSQRCRGVAPTSTARIAPPAASTRPTTSAWTVTERTRRSRYATTTTSISRSDHLDRAPEPVMLLERGPPLTSISWIVSMSVSPSRSQAAAIRSACSDGLTDCSPSRPPTQERRTMPTARLREDA